MSLRLTSILSNSFPIDGKGVGSQLCEAPEGPFRKLTPAPFSAGSLKLLPFSNRNDVQAEAITTICTGFLGPHPRMDAGRAHRCCRGALEADQWFCIGARA